ncbi:MAG: hypothetical protein KBT02_04855 [Treponema sp.]|nr:hypothetical protein [Candidatus Treponema caballi]
MEGNDVQKTNTEHTASKDYFIICTSLLSLMIAGLYFARIMTEGVNLKFIFLSAANLLYIPFILIFKRESFSFFFLFYSVVVVFILAFTKTALYNNFSALFILCIVYMLNPKLKIPALIVYAIAACTAFILNDEGIIHFLLHAARSAWLVCVLNYIFQRNYDRKSLILYDDEKMILDQLCNGTIYQKEVQGFSENTVYRKLKAARERNGNVTRDQLVEMYRKSKQQE